MDIEGYAKRALLSEEKSDEIEKRLSQRILEIKGNSISKHHANELAHAVMVESQATLKLNKDILIPIQSGITMGQFGVGSSHLDDSGVVKASKGEYLVVTVDGMHSRLSDYFLKCLIEIFIYLCGY